MRKSLIICMASYFLLILLTSTTYAGDTPKIGKPEAKRLIQSHISQYYVGVQTGSYNRCLNDDRFPAVKNFYQKLQEAGLMTVKMPDELKSREFGGFSQHFAQINCGFGTHPVPIEADLTKKGKRTSISSGNELSRVGFLIGKRTVDKIVSVTNDETVFFSYVYEPNELAKGLGDATKKYRGKAIIVYDPFLEEYQFKGFWSSPWEHEDWDDKTSWTYEQEGRTVFTAGIGTNRAKAPQSSPRDKRSVKTASMTSSQKPASQEPSHSSQQTKRRDLPEFERTFPTPFEETWSSVLRVFEKLGDTIEEVDKSKGVIKTEPSRRDRNWLMKYWVEYYVYVKDQKSDTTLVELRAEIYYREDSGLKKSSLKASGKTMKESADAFFSQLEELLL